MDYINYLKMQGKPDSTIKGYGYDIKVFSYYCKQKRKKIKDIKLEDLYSFLSWLTAERGVSLITRGRYISTLKSYYTFLYDLGKLRTNPTDKLHKPKIAQNESVYLNLEEAITLLTNVQKRSKRHSRRNYAMVVLFLNLGIRLGELVKINFEDIDWNTQQIKIRGKADKERTLYLNKMCISAIMKYTTKREGAMFLSERGNRISRREVQSIIQSELEAIGLEGYSTHKLRHTFASLLYQNGVDIRLLQKILGHEHLSTTEIYTHVKDEQILKASRKVEKLYEKL